MLTLRDFYKTVVELGMKADPRGEEAVKNLLKMEAKKFGELPEKEKADFDAEKMENPYADTRILNAGSGAAISTVLVGIDVEAPEIILADSLRKAGRKIDAAISHHPEGREEPTGAA